MSSLERLLSILDIYSEAEPIWTLAEIAREMNFTRSTTYRYVKALSDSGLLLSIGNGTHVLGPRFIEFDRQIRNCDPLLAAGREVMPDVRASIGEGLLLVCSLYGDKVLAIDHEPQNTPMTVSYTRGRPMPLFRGATAKVILAHLPERRLMKLYLQHRRDIEAAGLGGEWDEFRVRLRAIRRQRICETHGEVDPDLVGRAVAIFSVNKKIIGSLTLVTPEVKRISDDEIAGTLLRASERITAEIGRLISEHDASRGGYAPAVRLGNSAADAR